MRAREMDDALQAWKKVYADLADGVGTKSQARTDWDSLERDMLTTIDIEKLLAVERATVETGRMTG